jgi:hypothetical protein
MAKSDAQRAKERRDRAKRGERIERVVLKPGQAVVVIDIGEMADRLGVPEWSAEDPTIVVAVVDEQLRRQKRHA